MERIPGKIKAIPEDFIVDELPLYECSGSGEHLFVRIRKANWDNDAFRKHLCGTLGISDAEIGIAGIKDKFAITSQWVSIPRSCEARLGEIETEGVDVLETKYHDNKLRMGHLKANRFDILIRSTDPRCVAKAQVIAVSIAQGGIANEYGEQRFGSKGRNADTGAKIITATERIRLPRRKQKFFISAWQSKMFNSYLRFRQEQGALCVPLPGDIMIVQASGGMFTLSDPDAEAELISTGELIASGPMFGSKMRWPEGVPGDWERHVLANSGVSEEQLLALKKLGPGSRRALLLRPGNIEVVESSVGVRLRFDLPKGAYATTVLKEFLQPEVNEPAAESLINVASAHSKNEER